MSTLPPRAGKIARNMNSSRHSQSFAMESEIDPIQSDIDKNHYRSINPNREKEKRTLNTLKRVPSIQSYRTTVENNTKVFAEAVGPVVFSNKNKRAPLLKVSEPSKLIVNKA